MVATQNQINAALIICVKRQQTHFYRENINNNCFYQKYTLWWTSYLFFVSLWILGAELDWKRQTDRQIDSELSRPWLWMVAVSCLWCQCPCPARLIGQFQTNQQEPSSTLWARKDRGKLSGDKSVQLMFRFGQAKQIPAIWNDLLRLCTENVKHDILFTTIY